jgi:hypothetical protein
MNKNRYYKVGLAVEWTNIEAAYYQSDKYDYKDPVTHLFRLFSPVFYYELSFILTQ